MVYCGRYEGSAMIIYYNLVRSHPLGGYTFTGENVADDIGTVIPHYHENYSTLQEALREAEKDAAEFNTPVFVHPDLVKVVR